MFKSVNWLRRLVQTQRVGPAILISNSKRKNAMRQPKKMFSDIKIQFLRSAEYDHRLKIKNVVFADQEQVLTKAFDIVACPVWYDNVTSFFINLFNEHFAT